MKMEIDTDLWKSEVILIFRGKDDSYQIIPLEVKSKPTEETTEDKADKVTKKEITEETTDDDIIKATVKFYLKLSYYAYKFPDKLSVEQRREIVSQITKVFDKELNTNPEDKRSRA